jgi:pentapeptide MXKDX repeat protein
MPLSIRNAAFSFTLAVLSTVAGAANAQNSMSAKPADAMKKDSMATKGSDSMKADKMDKGAMGKDTMNPDGMKKDGMSSDAMKKDGMKDKKDAMSPKKM